MSGDIKLSVSNIAWDKSQDREMYGFLRDEGIEGLEIAPTRIFPEDPYAKLKEARQFRSMLFEEYHLQIPSMQSIWYGRNERIFGSEQEREALIEYSKRAFEFAQALGCGNLVFGCPKNRNVGPGESTEAALDFFGRLGQLACSCGTVLAIEANPVTYGTNYLNTTRGAYALAAELDSDGVKVNYDFGTVLYNNEPVPEIVQMAGLVHHVHISAPGLAEVTFDKRHRELISELEEAGYGGYVSLEMKSPGNTARIQQVIRKLKAVVREHEV